MSLAYPYLLLLWLALPVLAWLKGRRGPQPAFLYSSVGLLSGLSGTARSRAGTVLLALRWLALALLLAGLARPQLTESETSVKASGVDMVLVVDLSSSMESLDFELDHKPANRLAMAKDVLKKFIARRPNDRIGLVAFAGRAYVASPLTLDHEALLTNLDRLQIGMIEDSTAIGSALATSVNRLRGLKSKSKLVIFLTDGQNNAGTITPAAAAEAAKTLGVKVYTVGVGIRGTSLIPRRDFFGQTVLVREKVDIDEKTLQAIADETGGKYYRADNSEKFRAIYAEIDQLEKTEAEVKKYVRCRELMAWLVLPGLLLLLAETVLADTLWRKLP